MNESPTAPGDVKTSVARSRASRVWIFALSAVVMALLIPSYLLLRWALSAAIAPQAPVTETAGTPQDRVVVASYQADFQPDKPKAGWRYYWNDHGPVGDTNAYVELRWDGQHYV